MLALYHFGPVANSLPPLLCLLEKGVPFASHLLDSRKWDHHTPQFRAINPEGMVPVLVHSGRVIRESTVINEYLEDAFPLPPLRPAAALDRAAMRVLTKFVDEYFCPALTTIGAHGASKFAATLDQDDLQRRIRAMPNAEVAAKWRRVANAGFSEGELAEARRRLSVCLLRTEEQLAHGQPWLLPGGYSLADIKWYSMAAALPRVLPDEATPARAPLTLGWLDRMTGRAAVQALEQYRIAR